MLKLKSKDATFNWAKYIYLKFIDMARNFKVKAVEEKASHVGNIKFGLKVCWLLEKIGFRLRNPVDVHNSCLINKYFYNLQQKSLRL